MAKKPANAFRSILSSSGQAKGKLPEPATPASSSGRRLKPGYTQVGANIPLRLKKDVYKELQEQGKNFSQLVEELLTEWLTDK